MLFGKKKNDTEVVLEKSQIAYWNNIRVGSTVRIRDKQAITASLEETGTVDSLDCEVINHRLVQVTDSDYEQKLPINVHYYKLRGNDEEELMLIVRTIQDDSEEIIDICLATIPESIPPSGRQKLIDDDVCWFFDPPEDDENYIASSLTFCEAPGAPIIEQNGKEIEPKFVRTPVGLSFGYYRAGIKIPFMFVEYRDDDSELDNNRLIITEEAFLQDNGVPFEDGGIITLYLGCSVILEDIDVLKKKEE